MIRCIIIYYFRLSNVAYPSSTILPSRMRLQCKSARILQGKNYFNNSLFIEYYFFIKWWYFIIIFFRFYAVASQFQQCRDRMVEMPELVKNVCRIFYYKVNILAFLVLLLNPSLCNMVGNYIIMVEMPELVKNVCHMFYVSCIM